MTITDLTPGLKAREEAEAVRSRKVEKEQGLDRLKRKCASLQSRLDGKEHDKGGAGEQEKH